MDRAIAEQFVGHVVLGKLQDDHTFCSKLDYLSTDGVYGVFSTRDGRICINRLDDIVFMTQLNTAAISRHDRKNLTITIKDLR